MLDQIITELKRKPSSKPKPLGGGLTIRLITHDSGVFELIAWREKKTPSDTEIGTLVSIVKALDDPILVFRSSEAEVSADGRFYAYRVWWVTGDVTISWLRPAQPALPVLLSMDAAGTGGAFS